MSPPLRYASAGLAPVVFEQADRLKEVGAGIQIMPNSTRILRALGLEDAVRTRGFEPGFMLTRDMTTGDNLCRTQAKGAMAERFGAGWFQIYRADLLDILMSALAGADIRLNAPCVDGRAHGEWRGCPDRRWAARLFDVVVGCDGIRSLVRASFTANRVYASPVICVGARCPDRCWVTEKLS